MQHCFKYVLYVTGTGVDLKSIMQNAMALLTSDGTDVFVSTLFHAKQRFLLVR